MRSPSSLNAAAERSPHAVLAPSSERGRRPAASTASACFAAIAAFSSRTASRMARTAASTSCHSCSLNVGEISSSLEVPRRTRRSTRAATCSCVLCEIVFGDESTNVSTRDCALAPGGRAGLIAPSSRRLRSVAAACPTIRRSSMRSRSVASKSPPAPQNLSTTSRAPKRPYRKSSELTHSGCAAETTPSRSK